jgi:hypothetical protein
MDVVMKTDAVTGKTRLQEADFDEARRVVRVLPKNDEVRKYLKHPKTRVGWLAEGSTEWPNDAFTKRRIADGDVRIEAATEQPQASEQNASTQEQKAEPAKTEPAKAEPAKPQS